MNVLKKVGYGLLILFALFIFGKKELSGRKNIRVLKSQIKNDNGITLYTGNNMEIISIDSAVVETILPTGKIEITQGVHQIKVKFSKSRFYVIQTNKTYAYYLFNINFTDIGPYTFVGYENKGDSKIYFEALAGKPEEAEAFYKREIVPEILAKTKEN